MDFDELADRVQAATVSAVAAEVAAAAAAAVRPAFKVRASAWYRVDGVGMWRAAASGGVVTLRRWMSRDERSYTLEQWCVACRSGRVVEVG